MKTVEIGKREMEVHGQTVVFIHARVVRNRKLHMYDVFACSCSLLTGNSQSFVCFVLLFRFRCKIVFYCFLFVTFTSAMHKFRNYLK